jgi:toxin YoeB
MEVPWDPGAWNDYLYWQGTDKKILQRINDEHRLVYAVRDKRLHILQCRFHYDK